MEHTEITAIPDTRAYCILSHKMFTALGEVSFRRSETDGAAVMVVQMGEREVLLPLQSLRSTFEIDDYSEDGQMLTKVAEALDYVGTLYPGDKLPDEVVTGEASWTPDPEHLQIAVMRLRVQLATWLDGAATAGAHSDGRALLKLTDDRVMRKRVQTAMAKAAETLGLAGPEEVLKLIEDLARELSYIEAMRDRLMRRVDALARQVERLFRECRNDNSHAETIGQVHRLMGHAQKQIRGHFEEIDALASTILQMLRTAEEQRASIRKSRDWLYRHYRQWMPLLRDWDEWATADGDEGVWPLVTTTYHFLAPRFMNETEWVTAPDRESTKDRLVW